MGTSLGAQKEKLPTPHSGKELVPKVPFTDPETGKETYCPSNGERSAEGKTPAGSTWTYKEYRSRDSDGDSRGIYTFTLKPAAAENSDGNDKSYEVFEIKHVLDADRDSSSSEKKVTLNGEKVFDSESSAFRDDSTGKGGKSERGSESLDKALQQVAEFEGVSVKELLSALPKMCSLNRS